MKAFITTVAGLATRFSATLSTPIPKCIYYQTNPTHTLLFRMIEMVSEYDCLVIVGGFKFAELKHYVEEYIPEDLLKKITWVYNCEYSNYGSGWSLYLGINSLLSKSKCYSEILFAEGDLFFDKKTFEKIKKSPKDVITINASPITANKAVALYFDINNIPHYIFDTKHGFLEIKEPFVSIYNSGQVWKFSDVSSLKRMVENMNEDHHKGTNLVLINQYYQESVKHKRELSIIPFVEWTNTNTTLDFETLDFEKK